MTSLLLLTTIALAGSWDAETLEGMESGRITCRIRVDVVNDWCEPILYWGDGDTYRGECAILEVGHFREGSQLYWTQAQKGWPVLCFNTNWHLEMSRWYDVVVWFGPGDTGMSIDGVNQMSDVRWNFGQPGDFVPLKDCGGEYIYTGYGRLYCGDWCTLNGEVSNIVVTPEPSGLCVAFLSFLWRRGHRQHHRRFYSSQELDSPKDYKTLHRRCNVGYRIVSKGNHLPIDI